MAERKEDILIGKLLRGTEAGKVSWEKTVVPGQFLTTVPSQPSYGVILARSDYGDPTLMLRDLDGDEIKKISKVPSDPAAEDLARLYDTVRQQVLAPAGVMDILIAALGD